MDLPLSKKEQQQIEELLPPNDRYVSVVFFIIPFSNLSFSSLIRHLHDLFTFVDLFFRNNISSRCVPLVLLHNLKFIVCLLDVGQVQIELYRMYKFHHVIKILRVNHM